ncbi:hypothetical protein ACP70R_018829 [Stipagrostis hirtigluma subsp. patula]
MVAAAAVPAATAFAAAPAQPDPRAVEWWGPSTLTPEKMARLVRRRFLPEATKEQEWLLSAGEAVPAPPQGYVVSFARFHERGLAMPPHPFLLRVPHRYGVALHHLTPNGLQQMTIFIAVCEGYLGISPSLDVWMHFFDVELLWRPGLTGSKKKGDLRPVAAGRAGIRIRSSQRNDYIDSRLTESNQGWHGDWFYLKNSVPAGFPEFNFVLFEDRPESWWWGCAQEDAKKLGGHFAAFKTLREAGVSAATVLAAYHARGVALLMSRSLPLWCMTDSSEPAGTVFVQPPPDAARIEDRIKEALGKWAPEFPLPEFPPMRPHPAAPRFLLVSKPCVAPRTAEERAANRCKNEEDREASKRRKAAKQAEAVRHMETEQRRARKL